MARHHITMALLMVANLVAFSKGAPHLGMIDNEKMRDVGVAYSGPDFTGVPTLLIQSKNQPSCEPFDAPVGIASVAICKEGIVCNFFSSPDCNVDHDDQNSAFSIRCGDVAQLDNSLHQPHSYICGPETAESGSKVDILSVVVPSEPHDSSKDDKVKLRG